MDQRAGLALVAGPDQAVTRERVIVAQHVGVEVVERCDLAQVFGVAVVLARIFVDLDAAARNRACDARE